MHWKLAEKSYFKPDAFRRNLNACIQSARSVKFVLQKCKANFADFESWYATWQDRMRADALMKWAVNARNNIEKQGDLEAASTMRVTLVDSYIERDSIEFDLPPKTKPSEVANIFINSPLRPERLSSDASLSVERRWVASTLPDHEILSATAHGCRSLGNLVADAPGELGLPHVGSDESKPKCSLAPRQGRLRLIWTRTNR